MKKYIITATSTEIRDELIKELSQYPLIKIYESLHKVFIMELPQELAESLKLDPRIIGIEPERQYNLCNTRPISNTGNWGLDRIDQRALPLEGLYTYIQTGRNVDIYIQDTGIYANHSEFGSRVTVLFTAAGYSPSDDNGHGTHVAGICAGSTYGVAPLANLFSVRSFSSSGNASNIDLLDGFDAIKAHHQNKSSGNPSVVNMSFAGSASSTINDGVQTLIDAGIVCCVAAGNFNANANNYSPASLATAITVAACGKTDNFATFSNVSIPEAKVLSGPTVSNYGSAIDIIAPGIDIVSAGISSPTASISMSGTSMATPFVVGVCALYLEINRHATPAQVQQFIIDSSTKNAITLTSEAYTNNTPNRLLYSLFNQATFTLTWITPAGALAQVNQDEPYSVQLQGSSSDTNGNVRTVSYILANGQLPPGITLSGSGLLSGTAPSITSDSVYTFTVELTDTISTLQRTFSITVKYISKPPTWITPSGLIGTYRENTQINFIFKASDPQGQTLTYSLSGGILPSGITLASNGLLSGLIGTYGSNAAFDFSIRATDISGLYTDRDFSIAVQSLFVPLTWQTPSGLIGTVNENYSFVYQLVATSTNIDGSRRTILYSLSNGTLPPGLTLTTGGLITGIVSTVTSDTTFSFTVTADDGLTLKNNSFAIAVINTNKPPTWNTTAGSIGEFYATKSIVFQFSAYDPEGQQLNYSVVVGSFPPGITLNSTGLLSGTVGDVIDGTVYSFTLRVTDPLSGYADRNFSLITKSYYAPLTWTTPAGLIQTVKEQTVFNFQLDASSINPDNSNRTISYSIISGNLPGGLVLTNSGLINGIVGIVPTITTFSFTIKADDGLVTSNRDFSIVVNDINTPPTWITPQGDLGAWNYNLGVIVNPPVVWNEGSVLTYILKGSDPDFGDTMTFTLLSGSLPPGITLNNNGTISGTIGIVPSNTTFIFTVRLSDSKDSVDRRFSINVKNINYPPIWQTTLPQHYDGYGFIGIFNEGDNISFQFEGTDPEGNSLTYLVESGTLPDGISLSTSGYLSGTIRSVSTNSIEDNFNKVIDPNNPGHYLNNKIYRFAVGLSDGIDVVSQLFQITVTDNPKGPLPVWITPTNIGTFIEANPIYAQLKALAFLVPNENIYFTEVPSNRLPPGLSLMGTGEIYGVIDGISNDTTYTFGCVAHARIDQVTTIANAPVASVSIAENKYYIQALDTNIIYFNNGSTWVSLNINDFSTTKEFTITILNRQSFDIPKWTTPAGSLGDIYVYDKSTIDIFAKDNAGSSLIYNLIDGELPPGLTLHTSGAIIGTVQSYSITSAPYTFTVTANNAKNTSDPRTFTLNVKRYYVEPELKGNIVDIYLPITGEIRNKLSDEQYLPDSFLYRSFDSNFGRVTNKEVYIACGLYFNDPADFYMQLQQKNSLGLNYHRQDFNNPNNNGVWFTPDISYLHPNVYVGGYGWSTVHNSSGAAIYDVVWRQLIDPQARAWKEGRIETTKAFPSGESVDIVQTAIKYKEWNKPTNPYRNNALASVADAEYLEPQSIRNLRDELIEKFGINTPPEKIPEWILDKNTNLPLLLVPIAYVLPGKGNDSVALLNSYNLVNVPLKVDVDRWLIRYQLETIFDDQTTISDFINTTDNPTSPNYRTLHNITHLDLDDKAGKIIKWTSDSVSSLDTNPLLKEDDGFIRSPENQLEDDGVITQSPTIYENDGNIGLN
jgi:subtilisin family serine protease